MPRRNVELTEKQASDYISNRLWSHTPYTLASYRRDGIGPKFLRRGRRVFYPIPELDKYIEFKENEKFGPE